MLPHPSSSPFHAPCFECCTDIGVVFRPRRVSWVFFHPHQLPTPPSAAQHLFSSQITYVMACLSRQLRTHPPPPCSWIKFFTRRADPGITRPPLFQIFIHIKLSQPMSFARVYSVFVLLSQLSTLFSTHLPIGTVYLHVPSPPTTSIHHSHAHPRLPIDLFALLEPRKAQKNMTTRLRWVLIHSPATYPLCVFALLQSFTHALRWPPWDGHHRQGKTILLSSPLFVPLFPAAPLTATLPPSPLPLFLSLPSPFLTIPIEWPLVDP